MSICSSYCFRLGQVGRILRKQKNITHYTPPPEGDPEPGDAFKEAPQHVPPGYLKMKHSETSLFKYQKSNKEEPMQADIFGTYCFQTVFRNHPNNQNQLITKYQVSDFKVLMELKQNVSNNGTQEQFALRILDLVIKDII